MLYPLRILVLVLLSVGTAISSPHPTNTTAINCDAPTPATNDTAVAFSSGAQHTRRGLGSFIVAVPVNAFPGILNHFIGEGLKKARCHRKMKKLEKKKKQEEKKKEKNGKKKTDSKSYLTDE